MPVKRSGPGDDPTVTHWPGGLTWVAHPDESMRRASHALKVGPDGGPVARDAAPDGVDLWLVDPVDVHELDDLLADHGSVAGVVVLSGYHRRDAAAVAARHGVPVSLPRALAGLGPSLDVPVEVVEGRLPGTSYDLLTVRDWPGWREAALYDADAGTLVVGESLVSQAAGTGPGERLAVTPYARLVPPRRAFEGLAVERIIVGHGDPVLGDAQTALEAALADARRGFAAYLRRHPSYVVRAAHAALRN